MSMYTTVIVEDEHWARVSLRDKLKEFAEIEIIGEAKSIEEAKVLLHESNPDILFLDIQLKDGTGFDLLNEINFSGKIIFVTAYDEYAIRAFEINAIDYIMKPISENRLKEAVRRIHMANIPSNSQFSDNFNVDDRIMVTQKSFISFIKVSDIVCISAANEYASITTRDKKKYLVSKTITEWEKRLPHNAFNRIHRSHIINFEFIEKTIKLSPSAANIYLKGIEEPFKVSRFYYQKLKARYK